MNYLYLLFAVVPITWLIIRNYKRNKQDLIDKLVLKSTDKEMTGLLLNYKHTKTVYIRTISHRLEEFKKEMNDSCFAICLDLYCVQHRGLFDEIIEIKNNLINKINNSVNKINNLDESCDYNDLIELREKIIVEYINVETLGCDYVGELKQINNFFHEAMAVNDKNLLISLKSKALFLMENYLTKINE